MFFCAIIVINLYPFFSCCIITQNCPEAALFREKNGAIRLCVELRDLDEEQRATLLVDYVSSSDPHGFPQCNILAPSSGCEPPSI